MHDAHQHSSSRNRDFRDSLGVKVVRLKRTLFAVKTVVRFHPGIIRCIRATVFRRNEDSRRHRLPAGVCNSEKQLPHRLQVLSLVGDNLILRTAGNRWIHNDVFPLWFEINAIFDPSDDHRGLILS